MIPLSIQERFPTELWAAFARCRRLGEAALPLSAALLFCAPLPARAAQERVTSATLAKVQDAAFDHWWPKYKRLMETLIANQDREPGRLQVPPPQPEDLRQELRVSGAISNRYIPGYTFFGVQTQGAVFEGLFQMDPAGAVSVVINHDDPEDRRPLIEDNYIDHMNKLLDRADVTVDDAAEAASLARFFLSTFFNFHVHAEPASIDSVVQDELQRVRVLSSPREIPQGRRVLRFGDKRAFLLFHPVPARASQLVRPPVVTHPDDDSFLVKLFTWHPVRGEVKSWEILIEDDQFVYFRDTTVARWVPYRFEAPREARPVEPRPWAGQ